MYGTKQKEVRWGRKPDTRVSVSCCTVRCRVPLSGHFYCTHTPLNYIHVFVFNAIDQAFRKHGAGKVCGDSNFLTGNLLLLPLLHTSSSYRCSQSLTCTRSSSCRCSLRWAKSKVKAVRTANLREREREGFIDNEGERSQTHTHSRPPLQPRCLLLKSRACTQLLY